MKNNRTPKFLNKTKNNEIPIISINWHNCTRPIFYLYDNNNIIQPIRAAGILPISQGKIALLQEDDFFSDFGGKSLKGDIDSKSTALRECKEESDSKLIFYSDMLNKVIIIERARYALYPIELSSKQKQLLIESPFGHKNKKIEWFSIEELKRTNLHPRLSNVDFSNLII
jgi:hypothetical protein